MPGAFPDYLTPVVRNPDHGTELMTMRWGMPPFDDELTDSKATKVDPKNAKADSAPVNQGNR